MMKTSSTMFAALATLALCAAPALAEKRITKPTKAPVAAPVTKPLGTGLAILDDVQPTFAKVGEGYDVLNKKHAISEAKDTEPTLKLKGLNDAQVGAVARTRLVDIEYCWDRVPQAKRVETTATVKLSIEAIGAVTMTTVTGDGLRPEFKKCVADVAARWRFPVTDAASETEFAVALQTTKIAH